MEKAQKDMEEKIKSAIHLTLGITATAILLGF
jgi:hypothetical protein